MGKLSQSMIDKAAHANLIAYCQSHGIELKREGKEFVIKANDSIYISAEQPFKWYRHSTGEGGKAVDFAMQYLGMPFRDAVFEMLGKLPDVSIEPSEAIAYTPDTHTDQKRVIAYLCKRRGLDYKLVTSLIMCGFEKSCTDNSHQHYNSHDECTAFLGDFQLHMAFREKQIVFSDKTALSARIFTDINSTHTQKSHPVSYDHHSSYYRKLNSVIQSDFKNRECYNERQYRVRSAYGKEEYYYCKQPDIKEDGRSG